MNEFPRGTVTFLASDIQGSTEMFHRAMTWIEDTHGSEIPASDSGKIKAYLTRYLPFYATFEGIDPRLVDKALWACGKAMKPLACGPIS